MPVPTLLSNARGVVAGLYLFLHKIVNNSKFKYCIILALLMSVQCGRTLVAEVAVFIFPTLKNPAALTCVRLGCVHKIGNFFLVPIGFRLHRMLSMPVRAFVCYVVHTNTNINI